MILKVNIKYRVQIVKNQKKKKKWKCYNILYPIYKKKIFLKVEVSCYIISNR